jgi:hypothetical protein
VSILATAGAIRHLIGVPYLLFGVALVRWARPVSEFFASAHRWVWHRDSWFNEEPVGPWLMRVFGVLFAAGSAYWIVVGTG